MSTRIREWSPPALRLMLTLCAAITIPAIAQTTSAPATATAPASAPAPATDILSCKPTLVVAHRQPVAALYAYMTGHEQVISRLPRTFTAQMVLEEIVPTDRLPVAPQIGTRLANPLTTRPTTQTQSRLTTQPATKPG